MGGVSHSRQELPEEEGARPTQPALARVLVWEQYHHWLLGLPRL